MMPTKLWTLLALCALSAASGCTAVVQGAPLSSRPQMTQGMYLSTGGTPRPHRTLGFIQVTGYGVTAAGAIDAGDANFDSTVHGALAQTAARMGGHGVINIEFLDEDPPTPAERMSDMSQTIRSAQTGRGEIKTRNRTVVATGEVIQFLE